MSSADEQHNTKKSTAIEEGGPQIRPVVKEDGGNHKRPAVEEDLEGVQLSD